MLSHIKGLIKIKPINFISHLIRHDSKVVSNNESTYTVYETADILDVEDVRVISWCAQFKEELGVEYGCQFTVLTENDVNNLKLIRELRNKNCSDGDIRRALTMSN